MQWSFWAFKYVSTLFVKFLVLNIVVMMKRCSAEYSLFDTFLFALFEVCNLHDDREVFGNKHTTKQYKKNLFMYKYGNDTYYSANSQAAGIAHKHLRWIGVVPKEAN